MINRIIVLCGLFAMVILTTNAQNNSQRRKHGSEFLKNEIEINLHDQMNPFEEKGWMVDSNNIHRTDFSPLEDQLEEQFKNQKYIYSTKGSNSCPIVLDSILTYSFSSISDSTKGRLLKYTYDQNGNKILEINYYWSYDSNSWVGDKKIEYTYDQNGNKTLSISYVWDYLSNSWVNSVKNEYTYDQNRNETSSALYEWDTESNLWRVTYAKYEYTYDQNGNVTSEVYYGVDNSNNSWVKYSKMEYAYDQNGNNILKKWYYWDDESNVWDISSKCEYTYDQNENETLAISYLWDTESNSWVYYDKYENTYDQNGNVTLYAYYNWDAYTWDPDNNVWIGKWKYEYTYDQNENRIFELRYTWRTQSTIWELLEKHEYTYDQNGNETSSTYYKWDTESNAWDNRSKIEYTYDQNGNKVLEIHYYWDNGSNIWDIYSKCEYTYDQNENETSSINFLWNTASNTWVGRDKHEYTYDQNGNETSSAYYEWDTESNAWEGKDTKYEYTYDQNGNRILEIYYNWWGQDWLINKKKFHYFSLLDIFSYCVTNTICDGDSILWQGNYYKTEGTYYANYLSANGCDSIYQLNLIVNSSYHYIENEEICNGDSLLWNSNYYLQSGTYHDSLTSVSGCDSIYELTLTVNLLPAITANVNETHVCQGENITLTWNSNADTCFWDNGIINGVSFSPPVGTTTYTVTGTNFLTGCSNTALVDVTVNPIYMFPEIDSICDKDIYAWHDQNFISEGIYYDSLTTICNCDSIYKLELLVNPKPSSFIITGLTSVSESQVEIYSVPINPDLAYTWNTENGNIIEYPSGNSAKIQWGVDGKGLVITLSTNQFECKSDTAKLEINIGNTNVRDIVKNINIKIYPNPANKNLSVLCNEYFLMEIYDLSGRKLIVSEKEETDISDLTEGMYIVLIKDKEGIIKKLEKLVVE